MEQVGPSGFDAGWKMFTWAWKNKAELSDYLKRICSWFGSTKPGKRQRGGILIIGAGGTGKSTLARLLSGQYQSLLDTLGRYEESITIEKYQLNDAPEVEIVVPPGQSHRREATWRDVQADLASGKFRGVILVSAFGYHSLGEISYRDHSLYRGGGVKSFLPRFLEDRRREELDVLAHLVPHVRANRGKLWMLTVVAKADLWCAKEGDARRHYEVGKYGRTIAGLRRQLDQSRFRHEYVYPSLVVSNFATGKRELLKKTAQGYDHQRYGESLRRLFEVVDALRIWEEQT